MSVKSSVSPKLVRGVINTSLTDQEIESSIATAISIYTYKTSRDNIPNDLTIEVTRFLAAHFVSLKDPTTRPKSDKLGDATIEYSQNESNLGEGFLSTVWGQTAAAIDPTGKLLGGITVPPRCVNLCRRRSRRLRGFLH